MKTVSESSPNPFVLVGSTLGHTYLIEGVLGDGAHGVLYGARHLRLGSKCAVKVLSLPAGSQRDALLSAIGTCASTPHPYLAPPFDAMPLADGTLLLASALLDGEDLRNRVALRGKLTQTEGLEVVRQAAAGLLALHRRGLVHGNLSARNIFLLRYDDVAIDSALGESKGAQQIKLLDMGLYHCGGARVTVADDQQALAQLVLELVADLTLPQRRVLDKAQSAKPQARYPSMQEFWTAFEAAAPSAPVMVQPDGSVVRGAAPGAGASAQTAVVPRSAKPGKVPLPVSERPTLGRPEGAHRATFVLPKIKRKKPADQTADRPGLEDRLGRTLFRLLALAGACVVAVGLGVGGAVLFKQARPAPGRQLARGPKAPKPAAKAAAAPVPADTVTLRFVLSPPDAQVQVGGEDLPKEMQLELPRQKQALPVIAQAPGYMPYRSIVVPDADRTVNIALLARDAMDPRDKARDNDRPKKHKRKKHAAGKRMDD